MRAIISTVAMALVVGACGGDTAPPTSAAETTVAASGDAVHGEELFAATCAACHGPDAAGLPNLGADLIESAFVASQTDAEMLEFLSVGRPADDPANTVGVAMPPRGGNPSLTDEDLADIVAYLRDLG